MIYKVGILGVTGRMGSELCSLLGSGIDFMGDWFEPGDFVCQRKKVTTIETIPVRTLDEPAREPVHVWIDFSRPEATLALLEQAEAPVVVATTGFSDRERDRIRERSETLPILLTPNTSAGIHLIRQWLRLLPQASQAFSPDISIVEEHHRDKKDAPSGTSKMLAADLLSGGGHAVSTYSIRAGEILGTHTVNIVLGKEELTLTHRVSDRRIFAEGALRAARFLAKQKPGLYSMDDLAI